GVSSMAGSYVDRWLITGDGSAMVAKSAAAYGQVSWVPFILVPATFLLLLFPDGRLLSPRWRSIAWCAGFGIVGNLIAGVIRPGPIEDYPTLRSPYAIEGAARELFELSAVLAIAVGVVGSAMSLVRRFRSARGEQRRQIKWIAFAGSTAAVTIPVMTAAYGLVGEEIANGTMMLSVMGLPMATAAAIRQYRLYDIDLVINRALVYGLLTATLAGTYVGSVLLFQLALNGITKGSGLAVAASTLAVAAMFRPARTRIQRVVDRRFFRSRYDAALIVGTFSARLRDEIDLSMLGADLLDAVNATVQPAHASLWLRTETHRG
ncbi:hypothetical protein, partial [Aeromicrobium sp.]|uniref:hypothetical protein n=1 Tax=Aeromicrobium sp. TaxID=1871063 RepID=UPI003C346EC9